MVNSGEIISEISVIKGTKEKIMVVPEKECNLLIKSNEINSIEQIISLRENIQAPVKQGDYVGKITFKIGEREVGNVNLVSSENSDKISLSYLMNAFYKNLIHSV